MKKEFTVKPVSGYLALLLAVLFLGGAIGGFALDVNPARCYSDTAVYFYNSGIHSCVS